MLMLILLQFLLLRSFANKCSWNYRFDYVDNHFNIVYPDKNAVYFGMILPPNTTLFNVISKYTHPIASYFSIQIYEIGGVAYHYNDIELVGSLDALKYAGTEYNMLVQLNHTLSYFALFRIYASIAPVNVNMSTFYYWSGVPPRTLIDGVNYPLCDIDYGQQGNIYTNFTHNINPVSGTVCAMNEEFVFMDVPAGSLANADANYMIACVEPGKSYKLSMKLPSIMCSLDKEHPRIDEYYDVRYASLSIVSTTAPRPTVSTYKLPCDVVDFSVTVVVEDDIIMPGLLYRQLLPNEWFEHSIAKAKADCFDNVICIQAVMGDYYPKIRSL
jgi:hypothetical protein